jgi:hypothetical protein
VFARRLPSVAVRNCILLGTMTTPPLPASPCMRVRLDYTNTDGFLAGNRFYLSYAGSPPTPGNCTTLASDIASAWATNLESLVHGDWSLTEIDVLDIASYTGASGQWTGSNTGTNSGTQLSANAATNIEFDIARRYRGGKPRIFLPPPSQGEMVSAAKWSSSFITAANTGIAAFFTALEALSVGAVGTLAHVNLSYYEGFTNVTNSSGRTRAAPKYRTSALVDTVEGYATKATVGSQRRRRTATTY